jgi:hypothetical protein
MSETFRAQCNSASGDYVTAEISGDKVELVGHSGDDNVMNAFVTALNARTFARGILALADEIDGGEQAAVPAPVRSRPTVGDRVVITKYRNTTSGGFVGREGTLEVVDPDDDYLTYRVQFDGDRRGVWAADVRKVDEPEPIKVGDRVRVLDDDGGMTDRRFVGRIGTVKQLHARGDILPYLVEFGDGRGHHGAENGQWNCKVVERVDEVAETDAIKPGDRVRVTEDRANNADVKVGDVFTVASMETNLSPGVRTTDVPTRPGGWFFSLDVVEKVTDEPSADVEQPADVASVPSSRAALLEKAGELLGGPGFGSTADDLIKLADYLAGE